MSKQRTEWASPFHVISGALPNLAQLSHRQESKPSLSHALTRQSCFNEHLISNNKKRCQPSSCRLTIPRLHSSLAQCCTPLNNLCGPIQGLIDWSMAAVLRIIREVQCSSVLEHLLYLFVPQLHLCSYPSLAPVLVPLYVLVLLYLC